MNPAEAEQLAEQASDAFDAIKRGPSVASEAELPADESAAAAPAPAVYKRGNREMAARVDALHSEAQLCLEETPPKPTEALQLMQKAVFVAPQDARLYTLRAEAYVLSCDFRSAVLNLRKAMACAESEGGATAAVQRRLSEVLDVQGLSLLRSTMPGSREQAEEAFEAAAEADRMAVPPRFHLVCPAARHSPAHSPATADASVVLAGAGALRPRGLQRRHRCARRGDRAVAGQGRAALPPARQGPLDHQELRPQHAGRDDRHRDRPEDAGAEGAGGRPAQAV